MAIDWYASRFGVYHYEHRHAFLPEIFMSGWHAADLLYLRLGTEMPNWSLAADSDTLFLATGGNGHSVAIWLDTAQLMQIREADGRCVRVSLDLTILGAPLRLYMVGRKVNEYVWKGTASSDASFLRSVPAPVEPAILSNVVDLTRDRRGRLFPGVGKSLSGDG